MIFASRRSIALISLTLMALVASVTRVHAQTEVVEYYATDAIGSVRVVFDQSGVVKARSDYLPFGEQWQASGTLPSQRFTGQQRDTEEELDYFGARSFQPRSGRFTTVDPVFAGLFQPQAWNRYAYALNNPLSYLDPTGLWVICTTEPSGTLCSGGPEPGGPGGSGGGGDGVFQPDNPGDASGPSPGGGGGNGPQTPWPPPVPPPDVCDLDCELNNPENWKTAQLPLLSPSQAIVLAGRVGQVVRSAGPFVSGMRNTTAAVRMAQYRQAMEAAAVQRFPHLAHLIRGHHVVPQYLGGPKDGLIVPLVESYHQMITNAFRVAAPYGRGIQPTISQLEKIMIDVYTKYPIW